jgi:two-component system, NtrC family, response regulator GlrR
MNAPNILVVDDDPALLRVMALRLEKEGFGVQSVDSAERALVALALKLPDLVLTDLRMAGMDGMALFAAISKRYPGVPVIIMTAHGTIPDAVKATRRGVAGFIGKPFEAKDLLEEIQRALRVNASPRASTVDEGWRDEMVTRSPAMEAVLREARMVASTDASVLIQGESGTGKELLARAIHKASARAGAPFVAVNCGAMPENLLESELFGYIKGAFTGALRDSPGLLQSAHGGSVFLDEIGDMPAALQVKLLRTLQERKVRPLGATREIAIDVRILCATHRDLEKEMAQGRFREDLFYRLNVVSFVIPALKDRREDIALLANGFLKELAARYSRPARHFAAEAMELMMNARWPGNVRQLRNVVEKAVALSAEATVSSSVVERAIKHQAQEVASLDDAKKEFEREYLVRLLKQTRGNITQAAKLAQRNRSEFYSLLHRHGLEPADFKAPPP